MGFGEAIREPSGKIIGWIQSESNGDKILRDFNGRILGRYDNRLDVTKEPSGRIVARGYALTMLLK